MWGRKRSRTLTKAAFDLAEQVVMVDAKRKAAHFIRDQIKGRGVADETTMIGLARAVLEYKVESVKFDRALDNYRAARTRGKK